MLESCNPAAGGNASLDSPNSTTGVQPPELTPTPFTGAATKIVAGTFLLGVVAISLAVLYVIQVVFGHDRGYTRLYDDS